MLITQLLSLRRFVVEIGATPLAADNCSVAIPKRLIADKLEAAEPAVFVTISVPPVMVIVLEPPPAAMLLACTVPPLIFSVPVESPPAPPYLARRREVFTISVPPL